MSDKQKGYFVCIEGIDGSGKSTFIKNFQKNHKDKVLSTRMPGGSEFSETLRDHARGALISTMTQMLTYSACIIDCMEKTIKPAIDEGKVVVSDRSFLSTYTYQACGAPFSQAFIEVLKTAPVKPDLLIYIDIHPHVAFERESNEDRTDTPDRFSSASYQEKLRIYENYKNFFINYGNSTKLTVREHIADKLLVIDGNCDADTLYRRIDAAIKLNHKSKQIDNLQTEQNYEEVN